MFIRIFLDILPNTPLWWGIIMLLVGSISSLLGVLYALSAHDIKKLLAYHSIENIGIILLGLGSTLAFTALGLNSLAIVALIAALFHTLNHAVFKALLFMGAGSVISKTHTRNIEEYGGLIKLMPYTAFFFLIGSMAISALPPFNGFASEWLTFQSLFAGIQSSNMIAEWSFVIAAGSLAFTGGLAAACFVKVFGVTFLARSRSEEASHASESSISLKVSMAILSILTLVFGVLAGTVATSLSKVSESLNTLKGSGVAATIQNLSMTTQNVFASVSMPGILLGLLIIITVTVLIVNFISRKQKEITGITWDCGTKPSPRAEITATGFSRSIVTIFRGILQPTKQTDIEYHDANSRYFPKTRTVNLETTDIYKKYFYSPIHKLIIKVSQYVKKVQSGNVNAYVLYIFIVLIILLISGVIK